MVAFAHFVMKDNGLPIHINPQHVTQVRQTVEGEPAVYVAGRETPMVIEGTVDSAIRKLEAAAAGLRLVEQPYMQAEATTPVIDFSPAPPVQSAAPDPPPTPKRKPAKPKSARRASPKAAKTQPAVPAKSAQPDATPEDYGAATAWFRGNR